MVHLSIKYVGPITADGSCREIFDRLLFDDITQLPDDVRDRCAPEIFDLSKIRQFTFQTPKDEGGYRAVTSPAELLKDQGTYQLATLYFRVLQRPDGVLGALTQVALEWSGLDRLPLVLEPEPHQRYGGQLRFSSSADGVRIEPPAIHLVDTISGSFGWMSSAVLGHELGHFLMFYAYEGTMPDYGGHRGHDRIEVPPLQQAVPSGAAWSEGFANALYGLLDSQTDFYPSRVAQERPEWAALPQHDRLSNEWVIGGVLEQFMRREVHDSEANMIRLDVDVGRLGHVLTTMRTAGLQQTFAEFVADYLLLYPEEREAMLKTLDRYAMADVAETPHFLTRYVEAMREGEGQPEWLGMSDHAAKQRAWAFLCRTSQVDIRLRDTSRPLSDRARLYQEIRRYFRNAVRRSNALDLSGGP